MNMAGAWTEIEDAVIREYYPTKGSKGCEEILRGIGCVRTLGAIKEHAKLLKVKRDKATITRNVEDAWTEPELAILKTYFPKGGTQLVMGELVKNGYHRTSGAIATRAAILGVRVENTKRRMERSGETKLVNICLDTNIDSDVIDKLSRQRNRSEYIRELVRNDIREGEK